MKTHTQSEIWIYRIILVFGLIAIVCLVDIITIIVRGQPIPGIIAALGFVTLAGLVRILISPLNQGIFR